MLHCISHNGYYGTCFFALLHRNRIDHLRRKQLISLAFGYLFERLQVEHMRLRYVDLDRGLGLAKVSVKYFANGA
jgi:hypothetical protein